MEAIFKNRVYFTFLSFSLLFSAVLFKAFKIQVFDRDDLIKRSQGQIFREVKVYPKRGNIYDRNGNPLAINTQTYSIFTIPKLIEGTLPYKKLSKIVPELNYADVLEKIKNRTRYTWLARKIKLRKDQVLAIKELKGIYIDAVPKRFYPNHELLSQVIGFVGVDNIGLSGVEYFFDDELRGKPKVIKYIKDAKGRAIKFESDMVQSNSKDLHLSIDKDIQAISEKALKEAVLEFNANMGGVGVIDAETGEILAVANYPTFDPNVPQASKARYRKLSFVSDPFEPGSIFKTLTIASALENKIAGPDTSYYCEKGYLKIDGHVISEAEVKKKFEWLSVSEILEHSSNIGTTKIAFDLTFPKLKETLKNFNIGEKTGMELPAESRGIFPDAENIPPLSLSNISFGQGVATTGIQMLSAYAAILNNGVYIKPTILKGNKSNGKQIITSDTAKKLKKMLFKAVEDGTGKKAKVKYFKIAGKTSTGQRPSSNGGYQGYVAGFVGFPVETDKKFVILVYVDDPKEKSYYGNDVAAPVFKKIAHYMLYKDRNIINVAHDELNNVDLVNVKHSSTRVFGDGVMPNFIGLDRRSVYEIAKKYDLNIVHSGHGLVVKQNPLQQTQLSQGQKIYLKYSPPKYE